MVKAPGRFWSAVALAAGPLCFFGCCLVICLGCFLGCVSVIPIDDYTLARAAIDAAREHDAPHFAPGLWYKAETSYREAQKLFHDRAYSDAQSKFIEARYFAEKAENEARIKAFETGEGVPQ